MPRLLALAICAVVCFAQPARASLISPIDPIIGVRGDRAGSPDVTDSSVYPLSPCEGLVLGGYFCAPYTNNVGTITSMDLSFWDVNGLPIPNVIFSTESESQPNYFVAPESDLDGLLNGNDLFTVRLCDTSTTAGAAACGFIVDGPSLFLSTLFFTFESLQVFSNVDGFVSVRAVNTIPNLNLPPNSLPIDVPEPATIALLGLGAAFVAARRRAARPA